MTVSDIPGMARRRHRWFERTPKPVLDPKTGTERHERVCEVCKMTRITVIPPRGMVWIEWVDVKGRKSINGMTPRCDPGGEDSQ